jgi:hypothetical protein
LFRGYTPARVTDIQFVTHSNTYRDLEQLLVINTSHGTSHLYNLNQAQSINLEPVIKNEQVLVKADRPGD